MHTKAEQANESLNLDISHMTTLLLCICVFYTCVKVHTVP